VNTDELGQQLFARHCSACHGERGDGKGIAATFLFPKPRDVRAGCFRLVSTKNNVPTRDDLHAVLLRGMPGSSMPPWAHLSQTERDALVDEVLRIRREGAREAYVKTLKEVEELTDEEIAADDVQQEIRDYVEEFTTPGQGTAVPEIGTPTEASIAHGKEMYAKFACIQCHGESGKGDGAAPMVDDEGLPTRPRDFTLGIFKGNPDPALLYRRVAYGMPGTPMPRSSGMTPEPMVDLVQFVRSMSSEA
jgi:cytochrome c oxidase cbb3-type subunit 2